MKKRLVIGISGSSAPILGIRLLEELHRQGEVETHLVVSSAVSKTLAAEAPEYNLEKLKSLAQYYHPIDAISASIASGSFLTHGMVIIPCSMRTLAAVAAGQGDNLLTRSTQKRES